MVRLKSMKVLVFDQQTDLEIDAESARRVVREVVIHERKNFEEAAVYFVSKEKIARLHGEFFNDPTPTDCISFPMDEESERGYRFLGEVFVCPLVAIEYVLKSSEEIGVEVYREATLYLVHGLLHLMGYRDTSDEEVLAMRSAEQRHLEHLIRCHALLTPPS